MLSPLTRNSRPQPALLPTKPPAGGLPPPCRRCPRSTSPVRRTLSWRRPSTSLGGFAKNVGFTASLTDRLTWLPEPDQLLEHSRISIASVRKNHCSSSAYCEPGSNIWSMPNWVRAEGAIGKVTQAGVLL
jgi:hypothetical protein